MIAEIWSECRYRARALLRRYVVEQELDDEIRFHVENETAKYVRQGVALDEARRRARVMFGGVERTKDDTRDARGVSWAEIAEREVRYALRGLRNNPVFTAAVTITLALGIGANAAMFDVVDRLMFRPPTYLRDPSSVHRIYLRRTSHGEEQVTSDVEFTRYLDFVRFTRSFDAIAAFSASNMAVGDGITTQNSPVGIVTANFFSFFDARPVVGRFFGPDDDSLPIGKNVAVLGFGYWRSRFAEDPRVIGTSIRIGPRLFIIIGVAPEGFAGVASSPSQVAWIPASSYAGAAAFQKNPSEYYTRYDWIWAQMIARRKPGISIAAAAADLTQAYVRSWDKQREIDGGRPAANDPHLRGSLGPVQLMRSGSAARERRSMLWVSAVAVIVLLIACANVANLLLVRTLNRRREIALRFALGASRGRLVLQFMTESLLLAALGGVAGLLVARAGAVILQHIFAPDERAAPTIGSPRTLLAACTLVLFTAGLAGAASLMQARSSEGTPALNAGARPGERRRSRLRVSLLVFQSALSVLLLVVAGLCVRSLQHVESIPLGYDVDSVLHVSWNLRGVELSASEQVALAEREMAAARAVPGVVSVARASTVPLADHEAPKLIVAGLDSMDRFGHVTLQAGSPGYLATVGTRLVRGRDILSTDRADQPRVAVVSESMARAMWPRQEAIGRCFRINFATAPCTRIVGIAEDIKDDDVIKSSAFHYYLPIAQHDTEAAGGFVRVRGDASVLADLVRRAMQSELPAAAYAITTPMRAIVEPNFRSWRAGATLFLAFGALALVVAAVGLYSVIAYDVTQRTHEIGVRIALGAGLGDVLGLIVGDGVRFAAAGIVVGSGLALVGGRWIRPLLYDVSPRDPTVFALVVAALLVSAATASVLPAARAARVDPSVALRGE